MDGPLTCCCIHVHVLWPPLQTLALAAHIPCVATTDFYDADGWLVGACSFVTMHYELAVGTIKDTTALIILLVQCVSSVLMLCAFYRLYRNNSNVSGVT